MSVSYCLVAVELISDLSRTVRRRKHFYVLRRALANRNRASRGWGKSVGGKGGMSADHETAVPAWDGRWMTGSRRQPQRTLNGMRCDTVRRRGCLFWIWALSGKCECCAVTSSALYQSAGLFVICKDRIPSQPDLFPSCFEIFSFALLLLRVKINKAQRALVSVSIWLPYMC